MNKLEQIDDWTHYGQCLLIYLASFLIFNRLSKRPRFIEIILGVIFTACIVGFVVHWKIQGESSIYRDFGVKRFYQTN